MPPSALDQLTRLNVEYPMLFKITNRKQTRITHAGVLEFVADEGKIYLPYWMMRNLLLEEGDMAQIESVSMPVATFSKFQPQSVDFLDITNPKAVLENALRNFACLTTGDIIAIRYNNKIYELCVLETKPANAVTIIECDMNVRLLENCLNINIQVYTIYYTFLYRWNLRHQLIMLNLVHQRKMKKKCKWMKNCSMNQLDL